MFRKKTDSIEAYQTLLNVVQGANPEVVTAAYRQKVCEVLGIPESNITIDFDQYVENTLKNFAAMIEAFNGQIAHAYPDMPDDYQSLITSGHAESRFYSDKAKAMLHALPPGSGLSKQTNEEISFFTLDLGRQMRALEKLKNAHVGLSAPIPNVNRPLP